MINIRDEGNEALMRLPRAFVASSVAKHDDSAGDFQSLTSIMVSIYLLALVCSKTDGSSSHHISNSVFCSEQWRLVGVADESMTPLEARE